MSLRYIDKNGVSHIISGLTPGGDIEYGAVATRSGIESGINVAAGGSSFLHIEFTEPLPDDNYEVVLFPSETGDRKISCYPNARTANGFNIIYSNMGSTALTNFTITWKAFKLYDVADAEALYSKVLDIEAMIPSSASSTNKFATADDLDAETRGLNRRLYNVEDVIPSSASITNKLATAADVEEAMENAGLQVCEEAPSSPADGDVMLYIGDETGFTKGGIYQYVADPGAWILISGGEVADAITDGDMRAVTSNAVYDGLATKQNTLTFDTIPTSGSTNPVTSGGIYTAFQNKADVNLIYNNSSDLWQANHVYAVGDLVIYNNTLYSCTIAHTSGSSFTSSYWNVTTISSELNNKVEKLKTSRLVTLEIAIGMQRTITISTRQKYGSITISAISTNAQSASYFKIIGYNEFTGGRAECTYYRSKNSTISMFVSNIATVDSSPLFILGNPSTVGRQRISIVLDGDLTANDLILGEEVTNTLTTMGTNWISILRNNDLISSVTNGSTSPITSGGVYTAFSNLNIIGSSRRMCETKNGTGSWLAFDELYNVPAGTYIITAIRDKEVPINYQSVDTATGALSFSGNTALGIITTSTNGNVNLAVNTVSDTSYTICMKLERIA